MYNTFKPEQPMGLMDFVRAAKSCIREISPQELLDKLKNKEDMLLIDVRNWSLAALSRPSPIRLIPGTCRNWSPPGTARSLSIARPAGVPP
jgi:hypothetical protein